MNKIQLIVDIEFNELDTKNARWNEEIVRNVMNALADRVYNGFLTPEEANIYTSRIEVSCPAYGYVLVDTFDKDQYCKAKD